MTSRFLLALWVAAAATVVECSSVPLTMLTDASARCLDGTLSGYYHQAPAGGAAKDKWIFFLEGGGECTTAAACDAALDSALGSSKYFKQSIYMPFFLTDDAAVNPDFHDWHHVDVPYCSQVCLGGFLATLLMCFLQCLWAFVKALMLLMLFE